MNLPCFLCWSLSWSSVVSLVLLLSVLWSVSFWSGFFFQHLRSSVDVLLWLVNDNLVRHHAACTTLTLRIISQHNTYFDSEDTLSHQDVTNRFLDVVGLWVTSGDEVSITELHDLSTLSTQFSGHDHLATSGSIAHNEVQHTVASTTDW